METLDSEKLKYLKHGYKRAESCGTWVEEESHSSEIDARKHRYGSGSSLGNYNMGEIPRKKQEAEQSNIQKTGVEDERWKADIQRIRRKLGSMIQN